MSKFKKILAFILACLMVMSLAACGGSNDDYDDDDDDERVENPKDDNNNDKDDNDNEPGGKDDVTGDPTAPGNTDKPSHVHEWSDWEIDMEPTCYEEGLSVRYCSCGESDTQAIEKTEHTPGEWVVVTKPSATSDGLEALMCEVCNEQMETRSVGLDAEWTYHTDSLGYCDGYKSVNGSYRDVILDSFGNACYVAEGREEIEVYGNGYFLTSLDGVTYLKKVDGTVVCSTESLDVTGFGLMESYVDYTDFFEDGYILAYKSTNTYNGTKFEIGILGVDGQWIIPLSDKHPIITSGVDCSAATLNKHSYTYAGDGVLLLPAYDSPYDTMLYSIKTNEVKEINTNVSNWMLDYYISIAKFHNGVAYVDAKGVLYTIYANGLVTSSDLPVSSYVDFRVDGDGNQYVFGKTAIYINGELHKKLDFTASDAAWVGDAWLVRIKNPAGVYYYTYVDMDGQFLFEPVASDAVYICDVSGAGVGSNSDDGSKLVINRNGDILYTSTYNSAYIYVNKGVVCEETKGAFSSDETFTFLPEE